MRKLTIAFVHGYSVTNTDTYGEMPLRLRQEAAARGMEIKIENIFLGRYISFNDEVRIADIARALESAVQTQITGIGTARERFICITHSTGAPVVRTWWQNYYKGQGKTCPMSHLIMLAPANHGSALAQLGKSRLSRIKSWFDGVEPGQRVLDWLELGSNEAWKLNKEWVFEGQSEISPAGIFPFSIIGQDIDRKLYDHLNSYTGEIGSDGVVRIASANLNTRYIQLTQPEPVLKAGKWTTGKFEITDFQEAPQMPFRVVARKSHSGDKMGIVKSVQRATSDTASKETVDAIFDCIAVQDIAAYNSLFAKFATATDAVQQKERVEVEKKLLGKKYYIHDRHAMLIFRVHDSEGHNITDFDLLLTGVNHSPNGLPTGFFADRQCNKVNQSTVTYFFNYDVMHGCTSVISADGELLRGALPGMDTLGLIIQPRPEAGFIRYLPCELIASQDMFEKALKPNSTTMIDICLRRIVSTEVFQFDKLANENKAPDHNFRKIEPGQQIVKP